MPFRDTSSTNSQSSQSVDLSHQIANSIIVKKKKGKNDEN